MRDAGVLTFYSLANTAENGRMPVFRLVSVGTAFYEERTIGYGRFYAALGANQQIDALVRCLNTTIPKEAKYAILEDGNQYRIELKQTIQGTDDIDLTLVRLEENYDVLAEST